MLLLLLLGALFNGNSVALSERSIATIKNPAGLGFSPGFEISTIAQGEDYTVNVLLGNLGFSWDKKNNSYSIAEGLKLGQNLYLGVGYRYSQNSGDLYGGILLRPVNFLSIGATVGNYSDGLNYNVGFGIKPYEEYFKIYADYENREGEKGFDVGIEVQPLQGIMVNVSTKDLNSFSFGAQINLGNLLLAGKRYEGSNSFGFVISANTYPSFVVPKKVVVVKLKGSYDEMRPEGQLFARRQNSFFDLIMYLDSLASDKSVKGIFFHLENPAFTINQVEELRNVIQKARAKGKKTYAYSEDYYLGSFILAKSCDKVFMNPSGDIFIPGLAQVGLYFKNALEKIGIKPEFQRIGEYKSAAEPFIMDTMSSYNREQIYAYLKTVYDFAKEAIPAIDSIFELAIINAQKAYEEGLVDSLIFATDIENIIKKEFGKKIVIERAFKKSTSPVETKWAGNPWKIAYVVADGSIVTGESGDNPIPIFGGRNLGSNTIEKVFSRLEKDKKVKAVVLRVNSPGGSALASDIMWNAIRKTAQKKPVIISMGSVAASGGYYISSAGTKILASKTTLTGSIGVLNGKFVTLGLLERIGINAYPVKIGKYALTFSSFEELGPEGEEIMNKEIRWFYSRFLGRIKEGRGLEPDSVDKIGRGRIWSGRDANEIGLVDSIGGIREAIDLAQKLSKKKAEVVYYPTRKPSFNIPLMQLSEGLESVGELLTSPAYLELTRPLNTK